MSCYHVAGTARQRLSCRRRNRARDRLLREWGGELHEVTVTDRGYAYRGIVYTSLTAVAIRITGTRWSGPRPGLTAVAIRITEASPFHDQ